MKQQVNAGAVGKVEVSGLHFTTKDVVRHLKKGEGAQKEYRLLAEFENELSDEDLRMIEEKLIWRYALNSRRLCVFCIEGRI